MDKNLGRIALQTDSRNIIYQGSPSQLNNAGFAARQLTIALLAGYGAWVWTSVASLLCLVVAGYALLMLGIRLLSTACCEITIDDERITAREGIITRETGSLELFRIQDVVLTQHWTQRLFGLATLKILTSDRASPEWFLSGLRDADALRAHLNKASVELRDRKGYREVNMARV